MSAQGTLALADGQASPVTKSFTANGSFAQPSGGQLATWRDASSGIAIGFPTITLMVRQSSAKTDVDKRIMLPTLETISGSDGGYTPAPKVAYTVMSREQFVLPARSVTQNRKDILAFSKNMNADAVMQNAVWNLEPVW
jgi:hypothetical protein